MNFVAKILKSIIFILFNSSIPYECEISENVLFAYGGIGIVIHKRAVIGKGCTIGTNVTIGGRSKSKEVPIIGENAYIATGAKILGNIKIGEGSIIGANAVVIDDVPANSIVAGVPAKVIRTDIDRNDYI